MDLRELILIAVLVPALFGFRTLMRRWLSPDREESGRQEDEQPEKQLHPALILAGAVLIAAIGYWQGRPLYIGAGVLFGALTAWRLMRDYSAEDAGRTRVEELERFEEERGQR